MGGWFTERIVATGRLPLFCFFAGVVVGFLAGLYLASVVEKTVGWSSQRSQ